MVASFPVTLLAEDRSARLSYFREFTIAHPHLRDVDRMLWRAIKEPAGAGLIFVCGPTGVGKTTLRRHIEARLKETASTALTSSQAAAIGVDAPAPDTGNFSWGDFYRRTLKEIEQPFLPAGSEDAPVGIFRDRFGEIVFAKRIQREELRRELEQSLRHRRPPAVFIDEAQHLAKMSSGRKLQDQMDCLKSLSDHSQTLLVLIGTYELQSLRNLSGQLSRRSLHVHFPRYDASNEDLKAFRSVIYNLQLHLPITRTPNLLKHWEYLYTRSIGCVGILKDWLVRALAVALEEETPTVTMKLLQQQSLSAVQCEQIANEVIDGEKNFVESSSANQRLAERLGFLNLVTKAEPAESAVSTGGESETTAAAVRPRLPRSVAQRKPKRDRVG